MYMNFLIATVVLVSIIGMVISFILRRVVPTNEVHIVQSGKKTTSYGKDLADGNTYYAFWSWLPKIGVLVVKLPVSVFDSDLIGYDAYDKGRVPFVLDVKAFFRIADSNLAAQRVSSYTELLNQLKAILQGAIRTILASEDIEVILSGRAEFGLAFTKEVDEQLKSWGVTTVKMIELLDIRDGQGSKVIANIMEKKKSMIEMESRIAVAGNIKLAEVAEIEARREVEMSNQQANQVVGIRRAEVEREVGIAREQSTQIVQEQAAVTAEKQAAVLRVQTVKAAEIAREAAVVEADQEAITTVKIAEGALTGTKLAAEGVQATGEANAAAAKAMQLAPVEAQIVLAKEIGENEGYQTYLISIEQVKANRDVGMQQAEALKAAQIKVIANTGDASAGINSVGQLFSSKGGTQIGAMMEAFAQTDQGKAMLDTLGISTPRKQKNVADEASAANKPGVQIIRKSTLDE